MIGFRETQADQMVNTVLTVKEGFILRSQITLFYKSFFYKPTVELLTS